ncbi:MAG: DNA polymerase III subunit gamma/tau [Oscillospiraceae bacterium]|nr:DNA polymerase III subunit gamma/tau [Oscillospiraceae bacterium]
MYQALYRKWRPQAFSDVVGQGAICDTLTRQVETGHTSHAYLFSGSRGTGKTTCAKILSKAINCENPFHGNPCNKCPSCLGISSGEILDIVEIDAASNNGVDYVRDLRDEAIYSPANVKKRVYIIDEVHMFSTAAFNALLKIMEEPPAHVVFILATTELHKVPATIASRCQRFVFKRIPLSAISERLIFIAKNEGTELDPAAAEYIAGLSDGAMRDALSLLDQCISMSGERVTRETVEDIVGLAGKKQTYDMAVSIAHHDLKTTLSLLNEIYSGGKNINSVLTELAEIFRDVLISKTANMDAIPNLSARYTKAELTELGEGFDTLRLCSVIETLQAATSAIAQSSNKRIDAEICCVRLCQGAIKEDLSSIVARVNELSDLISNGAVVQKTSAVDAPPFDIDEPVKKEATPPPKKEEPKPVEKASESVPAPERKSSPAVPSGSADELWKKILNEARGKLSPGVTPLFGSICATLSDNMLTLSSEKEFAMQMLRKTENMDILRAATEKVAPGIIITAGGVKVEVPETSGIDELLSGLGDFDGVTIK